MQICKRRSNSIEAAIWLSISDAAIPASPKFGMSVAAEGTKTASAVI